MEEDYISIEIVTALLLYNNCILLNMVEICVTINNKVISITGGDGKLLYKRQEFFVKGHHTWDGS